MSYDTFDLITTIEQPRAQGGLNMPAASQLRNVLSRNDDQVFRSESAAVSVWSLRDQGPEHKEAILHTQPAA